MRILLPWSPMNSSFTSMVLGWRLATSASRLRNGEPTLPVCIASSILSVQRTAADCATICGCSTDHGGVRSLCGRRGMKKEKSSHGRSRWWREMVLEKSGGGRST